MKGSRRSSKKESRIAICCGNNPIVVISTRGGAIAHVFIINNSKELEDDKRFEEVKFMDLSCKGILDLPLEHSEVRWRELACLIHLLLTLSKGNVPHPSVYRRYLIGG
ncbi:hypothetical protein IPA_05075 [Ignicoccus pacificus DSM 13166]|uniref:Uncharacterized protein n=1 Tax=Ignicoccus pacificus DSM 13166 TaxID=940294 RepID=A0A977KBA1_9CREN|nr:hypothetical protein IPA_05075 [Ignicoccus pacificus DSM 13166]